MLKVMMTLCTICFSGMTIQHPSHFIVIHRTSRRWNVKKVSSIWSIILSLVLLLAGCSDMPLHKKTPIELTFWHVYGDQAHSPMNRLVDRFNNTIGREKGIVVCVTLLSNSADIHSALVAAAKKLPGSGELPDLFITYPKTALAIGADRLVDWKEHFSEPQLDDFVPSFLAEGEVDGRLILLPVAKSSNVLCINATIFERFSEETGIGYDALATWEGMFTAAKSYYKWSGGKAFFKYDDWMHYGMINTAALGGSFFKDKQINFQDPAFRNVWGKLAASAVSGEVCLLGGYLTTAMMTGEALCGVASTASIFYFQDTVTFSDNTTIPLRLKVLPVPSFEGGKALAIQRGGGLGLVKSSEEKERAAAVFAEWLTNEENNVPFAFETGYFPVKETAYRDFLKRHASQFQNGKYRELYNAIKKIHASHEFYTPPLFNSYGHVETDFTEAQLALFRKYRGTVSDTVEDSDAFIQKMFSELEASME